MESTPGLMNSLTSQALLVMATSSEGPLGVVQQPPCYTVPMTMDKPPQMSYLSPAYPLLYPTQDHLNSGCPPQLLSLSHQYGHPRPGVSVLGYGALHPFAAFRLPESMERLQAGFLNPKRLKGDSEPPQIHYLSMETGLEAPHMSPGPGIPPSSHRSSPKPRTSSSSKKDKKTSLSGPLVCPLCHKHLQKEELPHHLHHEMELMAHVPESESDNIPESSQNNSQSPLPGRNSRSESPMMTSEDGQKLDRQQVFLQIRWNREERMGARVGKCKRVRVNTQEVSGLISHDGETSEENRWEDDMRSPEKPSSQETDCRVSPGSSISSHSDESDSDETPSSSRANAENLEAMREKIQELTEKLRNTHTCHICLDAYTVPVASIQCWHIHCEACWLRALGTKKLCPQCNTITSPSDLRRVYL
ncbi:PREDICTED: E3 ubiquitin-protein ligase RNF220-like [Nanorana parkeri]|uniref:E3 ubiquitin-protein ligase RNF220-like n=1 Tax=Nanorana parkeri TaxID=125878 RepID=UPI0008540737|nr:PREDICTED: E3 ubiquitin-protein ligase RNF220-like [Nanorana parkeri]